MSLKQIQKNNLFLGLFVLICFLTLFTNSSNSQDMCPMSIDDLPVCTDAECTTSCVTENSICCAEPPTPYQCPPNLTNACDASLCQNDISKLCRVPKNCSEPATLPTCTSGDTMCGSCGADEFCCPADGTCKSTFSEACEDSSCSTGDLCVVPVLERDFKFINNCSETIWVGMLTNQFEGGFELTESCMSDADCLNACPAISGITNCTSSCVNGACMVEFTGNINTATADSISGRIWPMTGCSFDGSQECTGSDRCCDTGSCTIPGGGFGLQCNSSGDSPNTVAEFTFNSGANNDFYDVSLIDGYNVPVEMKPTGTEADPPVNFDTSYWCANPGGVESTVIPHVCNWDTTFGTDCAGNPDFRTVGSLQNCTSDSDCGGSQNCNSTAGICLSDSTCSNNTSVACSVNSDCGVCECKLDTDCNQSGDICGVPNPGFTGFNACGTQTGCTTAKDICGLYFGQGEGGDACGQEKLCASGVCETSTPMSCTTSAECNNNSQCKMDFCDNDPSMTCTIDSECGAGNSCIKVKSCTNNPGKTCTDDVNCNVAVCSGGECQCIPNLCVSGTCTNDALSCNVDSDCETTCTGSCTDSPAELFDCNDLVQTNKQVACSVDSDCPSLVGLPACTSHSDCPVNTTCENFGAKPAPGKPEIAKVCRLTCSGGFCSGPTCSDNSDCTGISNGVSLSGTFMQCDTGLGSCVATNTSLYEGAGLTGQSCYINYYDEQVSPSVSCNGCPTICDDPPCMPAQAANTNWPAPALGDSCLNTNTDWVSIAEPLVEGFKKACPSAYSFPFDDPTSTYQCTNNTLSNSMSYQVTFCPVKTTNVPPFIIPIPDEEDTIEDPIKINPGSNGPFVSIEFDPELDGGGQILVGLPPGVLAEFAELDPVVGDCEIVSQNSRVTNPDVICRVEDFPENLDMRIEFCRESDQQGVVQAAVEVVSDGIPEEEFSNFLDILLDELDICSSGDDGTGDDSEDDTGDLSDGDGTGGCSVAPAGGISNEIFLLLLVPGLIIIRRIIKQM